MFSRALLSVTLLLVLAIGVFADPALESDDSQVSPPVYTRVTMDSYEVERMLVIARNWPSIAPYWTRQALLTACYIPVRGIAGCSATGFVTSLKLDRAREITSLPRLEAFETLAYLESFVSSLPFTQPLPATWVPRLLNLKTISMVGTRIPGGTIPNWTDFRFTRLKYFELEFSPIGDVFQYPGGAIPSWFVNLDHLKLSFVNFGSMANFAPIIQRVITFNLTNCGWNYLLPSSSTSNYRLARLSITAPLAHSGGSSTPLPSRTVQMNMFYSLKVVELLNMPTITTFPVFAPSLFNLTLRNLHNLRGVFTPALLGYSSTLKSLEISRCPQLTGTVPMPTYPDSSPLESIIIRDCGFTGFLTNNLFRIPILKTAIFVGINKMSPAAMPYPFTYQSCSIKTLIMSSIQLTGTIPPTIATRCSSLERIDLSYNQLAGTIPSAWTTNSLLEFTVASNTLSGNLPPALTWSRTAVAASSFSRGNTILNVRNNQLTGLIPSMYFNTKFEDFDVSNNRLSLCLNSAAIGSKALSSLNYGACALGSQGTSWCSCANVWPASCNPTRTCS